MHVGIAMFATDYSMHPAELAVALEERGFESYWFSEHSHIPLSRESDFPKGGDLPKKYYDVMDPFVVMGAAAAVTTTLRPTSRPWPLAADTISPRPCSLPSRPSAVRGRR